MDRLDSMLVVGATGGIGAAIVRRIAPRCSPNSRYLVGREPQALHALAEEVGGGTCLQVDLSRPQDVENQLASVARRKHSLVVFAAGMSGGGHLADLHQEQWRTCFDVNALSFVEVVRALMPTFRLSADPCRVVAIGSIAGRTIYSRGGAYSASKHALRAVTLSFFEEFREDNVSFTLIDPGYVDTTMVEGKLLRDRMIPPDDVAGMVAAVVELSPRTCPTEIVLRPQRTPYP